jgi:hypothetical protein
MKVDGPVALFGADVAGDEPAFHCEGMMLSLLGTAPAPTLRKWFSSLSKAGRVVEDLQMRPWGACDGQVIDRYGLHWLIGFEEEDGGLSSAGSWDDGRCGQGSSSDAWTGAAAERDRVARGVVLHSSGCVVVVRGLFDRSRGRG